MHEWHFSIFRSTFPQFYLINTIFFIVRSRLKGAGWFFSCWLCQPPPPLTGWGYKSLQWTSGYGLHSHHSHSTCGHWARPCLGSLGPAQKGFVQQLLGQRGEQWFVVNLQDCADPDHRENAMAWSSEGWYRGERSHTTPENLGPQTWLNLPTLPPFLKPTYEPPPLVLKKNPLHRPDHQFGTYNMSPPQQPTWGHFSCATGNELWPPSTHDPTRRLLSDGGVTFHFFGHVTFLATY